MGAGPGDPELITLKGVLAIQQADVILHDSLVSEELLDYAPPGCRLVSVGKRKGEKELSQDEINQLLLFYAADNHCVVRLKGGDPFVFGRGHEELEYLLRSGIRAEAIPGISSALAAPASAGIPLTKRGVNESFWVVTGTVSDGSVSKDIYLAARSSATIIILMGLSQLDAIASMIRETRSPLEPIAIVQDATCATQKVIIGSATTIIHEAAYHQIISPAVIIIGKVVDESHMLSTVSAIHHQFKL